MWGQASPCQGPARAAARCVQLKRRWQSGADAQVCCLFNPLEFCFPWTDDAGKLSQPTQSAVDAVGKCQSLSHFWLSYPRDCSPPGSSVHGILQARTLEGVAMPSSRETSQPRNQTQISHTAGGFFTFWTPCNDDLSSNPLSSFGNSGKCFIPRPWFLQHMGLFPDPRVMLRKKRINEILQTICVA